MLRNLIAEICSAKDCNIIKSDTPARVFSRFLNYTNVTKSRNEPPTDFPFPLQFSVPTNKNSQLVFTIP